MTPLQIFEILGLWSMALSFVYLVHNTRTWNGHLLNRQVYELVQDAEADGKLAAIIGGLEAEAKADGSLKFAALKSEGAAAPVETGGGGVGGNGSSSGA